MRKIKSNFFISLDGVVESPDKWHFPYFDDEMGAAVGAGFATADAMLMGRVLYEEWAAYWPEHADEPFGDVMNSTKKYVVSNSLQAAEWQNSEIVSGDVAQRLTELKAQDGGDIAMSGSATTVALAAARGPARRAQPAGAPDRRRRWPGAAVSAGRAEHPARAPERADVQDRRAEPQLRPGQRLTAGALVRHSIHAVHSGPPRGERGAPHATSATRERARVEVADIEQRHRPLQPAQASGTFCGGMARESTGNECAGCVVLGLTPPQPATKEGNCRRPVGGGASLKGDTMNATRHNPRRRAARRLLAGAVLSAGVLAATSAPANAATTATFSSGALSVFGDSARQLDRRSAAMRRARSW